MSAINHLHLHVRDVEASRAFYAAHFGLREHARHGAILFMRDAGGLDLALAPDPAPAPMPAWFHFGFRQVDAAAVACLHDRLASAGVPIPAPLAGDEAWTSFRCEDPDGYRIEVYWEA